MQHQKERWQDHKLKTAAKVAGLGMYYRYRIHGNKARFRAQAQMFHRDVATIGSGVRSYRHAKLSTQAGIGAAAVGGGAYLAYHNRDSIRRGAQRVHNKVDDFKHNRDTRKEVAFKTAKGYSALQVTRGVGNITSGAKNRSNRKIAYGTGQVLTGAAVMSETRRRQRGEPFKRPRKG